eukprot:scaffold4112_cov110-Isochrysis_galbana.AAC.4
MADRSSNVCDSSAMLTFSASAAACSGLDTRVPASRSTSRIASACARTTSCSALKVSRTISCTGRHSCVPSSRSLSGSRRERGGMPVRGQGAPGSALTRALAARRSDQGFALCLPFRSKGANLVHTICSSQK